MKKPQKGQIALVSVSHLINDTHMGFLAVLLPYFVARWGISLAEAGGLVTAFLAASYFGQPVFGWLSDRLGGRGFLAGGPLVGACFIGTIGVLPSFGWTFPWVIMAGLGSAAFHPAAADLAMRVGGGRSALSTSIFLMTGFLGVAIGPLEILAVVTRFGLESSYLTILPGAVISILLFRKVSLRKEPYTIGGALPVLSHVAEVWRPLSGLWTIVVLRNLTNGAFYSFLPLLLMERGLSVLAGGTALSVFLTFCALGGVLGGYLSDRFDRRAIIALTLMLAALLLGVFLLTGGPLSMAFLMSGGFFLMMSGPINLVIAQEMFPAQAGLLASLMMGFAYGVGSLAIVGVGAAADWLGMPATMAGVVAVPLIAAWLGLRLPKRGSSAQSASRPGSLLP
ncbi:MAG: MFS transporter [Nitrospinota bacterium]